MKKILLLLFALIGCIQLSEAQTADGDCAARHIGNYCFHNTTKDVLKLKVTYCYRPVDSTQPGYKTTGIDFTLQPGESKTINDVLASPGVRNNFVARKDGDTAVVDEGDFGIEQCKTKTHEIK